MKKTFKGCISVCCCLVLLLIALSVGASENASEITLLQKDFADANPTVQLFAETVDANLAWDISYDKTKINVGDTVTATISIKNNSTVDFTDGGGIQFDIHYDNDMFEALTLDKINICDDISSVSKRENNNGDFSVYRFGTSFSISAGASVALAEIEFTAKNGIVETENSKLTADKLYFTRAKLTSYDASTLYLNSDRIDVGNNIDIYDIKVSFKPGSFGILSGQTVAYARYNEAGLFTDSTYNVAFTLPVIIANTRQTNDTFGYRVSDKGWLYNSTDKFTQNSEFTAQYTKTQNIRFINSNGSNNEILVVTDNGANVEVPQAATGFAGWFDASIDKFTGKLSELIVNIPIATEDKAYKAYFYADSDFSVAETFATVAPQSGVAADKKVVGDIAFTVSAPSWATIKSVKAFCGDNEVNVAIENNNYVVLNSHLSGDVSIKVVTEVKGSVIITPKFSYTIYEFTPTFAEANTGYYRVGNLNFAKRSDGKYLANDETKTYTDSAAIKEKMNFVEGNEILISELGDLDESGDTDIRDVQEIFTYYTNGIILGNDTGKAKRWFAADMNKDNIIDISDAQLAVIKMLN